MSVEAPPLPEGTKSDASETEVNLLFGKAGLVQPKRLTALFYVMNRSVSNLIYIRLYFKEK